MAQTIVPAVGRDFNIQHIVIAFFLYPVYFERMKSECICQYLCAWERRIKKFIQPKAGYFHT